MVDEWKYFSVWRFIYIMTRWSFREGKSATDMYSTDTVTLIFIGGRIIISESGFTIIKLDKWQVVISTQDIANSNWTKK